MVEYRIIKRCRICSQRFIVNKGEAKRIYCDKCQSKLDKRRR